MNLVTDNDFVRDYIAQAINAASTIEWQLGPLINMIVTQLFSSQLILKSFVVIPFFICALWYILHSSIFPSKRHMHVRLHLCRPPPPFSVRIQDSIIATRPSILSAIHIAPVWLPSSIHHIRKVLNSPPWINNLSNHTNEEGTKDNYSFLWPLLYFSTFATPAHTLSETNHVLIKGDMSSDKKIQNQYVNTIIDALNDDQNSGTASDSTSATAKWHIITRTYAHTILYNSHT